MTLFAESKIVNLERSVFKLVYDNLEVGKSLAGLISYDDDLFDTTGKSKWVKINFLDIGIRKYSEQEFQITCATRILDDDPQGLTLKKLVDDARDALNVNSVDIYDWSDTTTPVAVVRDLGLGPPQILRAGIRCVGPNPRQPTLDGIASHVLTYRLWLWRDDIVQ